MRSSTNGIIRIEPRRCSGWWVLATRSSVTRMKQTFVPFRPPLTERRMSMSTQGPGRNASQPITRRRSSKRKMSSSSSTSGMTKTKKGSRWICFAGTTLFMKERESGCSVPIRAVKPNGSRKKANVLVEQSKRIKGSAEEGGGFKKEILLGSIRESKSKRLGTGDRVCPQRSKYVHMNRKRFFLTLKATCHSIGSVFPCHL